MVTTQTRWDVFLPVNARYYGVDSSMDVLGEGAWANPRAATAELMRRTADGKVQMGQPLRISLPTSRIRYSFEKLYARVC